MFFFFVFFVFFAFLTLIFSGVLLDLNVFLMGKGGVLVYFFNGLLICVGGLMLVSLVF